jgi:1-acyl-sn-glycerol-3-phosphate acyltransferase
MPTAIQLENPAAAETRDSSAPVPFARQAGAHARFIAGGLSLTLRSLFRLGVANPGRERLELHKGFARYLALLERRGIIQTEFIGFEDAASWHGSVIAPNHPSILDALLIASRLPGIDCVMNSRLLRDPVMRGAANLCGFIRNDTPLSMVRDTQNRLTAGHNVLIFPEGTRTPNNATVGQFRHGYALAAARSGALIRTVLIECDSDYFGREFAFFRPAPCPVRYRITASRVFQPLASEDPRNVSAGIEEFFRGSLARDGRALRRSKP